MYTFPESYHREDTSSEIKHVSGLVLDVHGGHLLGGWVNEQEIINELHQAKQTFHCHPSNVN